MTITKCCLITLLFCSFRVKAQYYNLLNLTEKQVRQNVTEYPLVTRDSSKHEFVPYLTFKNEIGEVQLVSYFMANRCYMIYSYSGKETFKAIVDMTSQSFSSIGYNRWQSKEGNFEVSVHSLPDRVVTIYSRGISKY